MADKYFQFQERRIKRQLQKMISSENKIVDMYDEQSLILTNFLITSGSELSISEQELIATALVKFAQLAMRGNILADLEELIPDDDTADVLFAKIASGQIWENAEEKQYIDRDALWNYLTNMSSTHDDSYDENYTWIVDNLADITACMNRVNMLNPEQEPQLLQTEIAIELIDETRRRMYSECLNMFSIDSKIININKKLESLISKFLATEDSFIKSCQLQVLVLEYFKENHTFSNTDLDKLNKAIKHYGQLKDIWSDNIPNNLTLNDDSANSDFMQDGTFMRHRRLNAFVITMNHISGLKDYKNHLASLSWLMINQIAILDILSNAAGGLDKLNSDFPLVKMHVAKIRTQMSQINDILRFCKTELNQFTSNLTHSEMNFTNAMEAQNAVGEMVNTFDSMIISANLGRQQLELLTDFSKELGKCKQTYASQTGKLFSWNHNPMFQFVSDLMVLIECNAEGKIGMLTQHITQNLSKHTWYTDLIPILKNFLEKAAAHSNHSGTMEHSQISSPGLI